MAPETPMKGLQDFDLERLGDINNIDAWPLAVRIIVCSLVFLGVLVGGYLVHVTDLQQALGDVRAVEAALRKDYERKFFQVAHLASYREQQNKMEKSFDAILKQLPADTEASGLIDDITQIGLKNGLTFTGIELQPEVEHEFHVEKPIVMAVSGSYHGLGLFVSDLVDLSRIVTMHDISIRPLPDTTGLQGSDGNLAMEILAKTYRYKHERNDAAE